jgi:fatty-acyl-CoA synthase
MSASPRIAPSDGLSHVAGGDRPPLSRLTIPAFLAEAVRRHGDREAAVFRAAGERWTYAELRRVSTGWPPGSSASGSTRATGSASGRPTGRNG